MTDSARVPTSTALDAWLDKLSQARGAPGGGAACGLMLAASAALLRMVAEYTPDDERAADCAARLVDRRREALEAAEADGIHSAALGAALALDSDEAGRDEQVRKAAIEATRSSAVLGDVGIALLDELRLIAEIGNRSLAADLVVAGEALVAGLGAASVNARANLRLARSHREDDDDADAALDALDADVVRLREARTAASEIADAASARFDEG